MLTTLSLSRSFVDERTSFVFPFICIAILKFFINNVIIHKKKKVMVATIDLNENLPIPLIP